MCRAGRSPGLQLRLASFSAFELAFVVPATEVLDGGASQRRTHLVFGAVLDAALALPPLDAMHGQPRDAGSLAQDTRSESSASSTTTLMLGRARDGHPPTGVRHSAKNDVARFSRAHDQAWFEMCERLRDSARLGLGSPLRPQRRAARGPRRAVAPSGVVKCASGGSTGHGNRINTAGRCHELHLVDGSARVCRVVGGTKGGPGPMTLGLAGAHGTCVLVDHDATEGDRS